MGEPHIGKGELLIGTVVPNEQYPSLYLGVKVLGSGSVLLGQNSWFQNHNVLSPEAAVRLAEVLISAASKAGLVRQAAEEIKRAESLLAKANADRLAAISAGEADMTVHVTVELESK